jgi:hypothetical protein
MHFMKKTVLALGLLLTTSVSLLAQNEDAGFRFGVHVSPTWSWMRSNDKNIESAGSNWGIKVGVLGDFFFAPNYAIFTGLGWGFNQGGTLQNGYQLGVFWPKSDLSGPQFDTLPAQAKLHYRINYVEIPIGLKLRGGSSEDSPIKFYAEIPVFTLGFKTKAVGDIRGTNNRNTEDETISEDVKSLSLSWGLGGGIEYELNANARLVGGLSYQQQFTDATGDSSVFRNGAWAPSDPKGTIGLISLRIGIFF